jgi:hypothetical protein
VQSLSSAFEVLPNELPRVLPPAMTTEKTRSKDQTFVIERPVDSKHPYEGDEALGLVGAERSTQFSEEYFLKLRRKLVGVLVTYPLYRQ